MEGGEYTHIMIILTMLVPLCSAWPSCSTTLSASNVLYANAMEAIGVNYAMQSYHALKSAHGRRVPYTHVRTNSDYTHGPLNQVRAWRGTACITTCMAAEVSCPYRSG